MTLGEIFSKSIRYPFSDISTLVFVGIFTLLVSLPQIVTSFGIESVTVSALAAIISLIFGIVLSGYAVSVIKKGIDDSDDFPEIDLRTNLINGIKALIINIAYFIIPIIIAVILAVIAGSIGVGLNNAVAALGIFAVLVIILFIVFSILEMVAMARFADTDSLDEALKIGAVIDDIKRIGILNIIAFLIIAFIIVFVAIIVGSLISLIPYIGIIITSVIVMAFVVLFYYKALGLLYADA